MQHLNKATKSSNSTVIKRLLSCVLVWQLAQVSVFAQETVSAAAVPAGPAVLVEYNGQFQGFFEAPRLSQVLAPYAADTSKHWPTAVLYRLDPDYLQNIEQLRSNVQAQLRQLTIAWKDDVPLAAALMELHNQIATWRLAKPIPLPLDADAVQINPLLDAKLDAGSYSLRLKGRPAVVSFIGIGGEQFVVHKPRYAVYQYLQQTQQRLWHNVDTVYWVRPWQQHQADVMPVPVASWNRNQQALPVGSTIFVPLPNHVIAEQAPQLNLQLQTLLYHRVGK